MRTIRIFISISLGLSAALSVLWISAQAARPPVVLESVNTTYTVCAIGCDFSSLQAAIDGAAAGDTLSLAGETFTESVTVNKSLTIQGAGADSTIVQAAGAPGIAASRVMAITAGISVTLDGLTIRHGVAQGGYPANFGGGIYNRGVLTLTHCLVTSNMAYIGGGLLNDGSYGAASLTVDHSTISNNSSTNSGGGIGNYGDAGQAILHIHTSTIIDNQSPQGGGISNNGYNGDSRMSIAHSAVISNTGSAFAGGIYNFNFGDSGQAIMSLTHSSILSNTSDAYAGGIYNYQSAGLASLSVAQSTFSGNSADTFGGGINNYGGVLTLTHSTIYSNSASSIYGGIRSWGGIVTFSNNVLGGNLNGDCDMGGGGTLNDNGYNLVEDGACISAGTSFSGDPMLDRLADNGGHATGTGGDPVLTIAPNPGSPVLDAIPAGVCAAPDDQRGVSRPQGPGCDIGSFELEITTIQISMSVDDLTPEPGQVITFTIVATPLGADASGGLISDTLPLGLNFMGPIRLDPQDAGSPGFTPPMLATGLAVSESQQVKITFPVSVSFGLAGGVELVNIAAVSSIQVITPVLESITVTVVNAPPLALDDSGVGFITDEDTPFTTANVLTNDMDPNGSALSVAAIDTGSTVGLVTDDGNGAFNYDPGGQFDALALGEQANDVFGYVVSDGFLTSTATVTINIQGVNDKPVVNAGLDQTTEAGTAVTLSATFSDLDASNIHTAEVDWGDGTVEAGIVNQGAGTISGSHVYSSAGEYTVTVAISDNDGGQHSDPFTVTVNPAGAGDYKVFLPIIIR